MAVWIFFLCSPDCPKQPRIDNSFHRFLYPMISGTISGPLVHIIIFQFYVIYCYLYLFWDFWPPYLKYQDQVVRSDLTTKNSRLKKSPCVIGLKIIKEMCWQTSPLWKEWAHCAFWHLSLHSSSHLLLWVIFSLFLANLWIKSCSGLFLWNIEWLSKSSPIPEQNRGQKKKKG